MRNGLNDIRHVTLELTNQCNLRCRICRIWTERPTKTMPARSIRNVLEKLPSLTGVSLTGGEPLLHPEIDNIYRYLCALYLKRKLRSIHIATNAASSALPAFLKKHRALLAPLSLSISLDGRSAAHDRQRGLRGSFAHTIKNIKLARKYNIPVTIKFVASRLNYEELPHVSAIAQKLGCAFMFKMVEKLPAYYHRAGTRQLPLLRQRELKILRTLVEGLSPETMPTPLEALSLQWHKNFLQTGTLDFIHSCQTPTRCLFITSHGDIYNCLYQKKIGTLKTFPDRINGRIARRNIQRGEKGTCPRCLAYHGSLKTFHASSHKHEQGGE
jgi:MoaA/NifB/PqqE/SkfB family radical SAM enzyme